MPDPTVFEVTARDILIRQTQKIIALEARNAALEAENQALKEALTEIADIAWKPLITAEVKIPRIQTIIQVAALAQAAPKSTQKCPHINCGGHESESWCLDCGERWPNNLLKHYTAIARNPDEK